MEVGGGSTDFGRDAGTPGEEKRPQPNPVEGAGTGP